LTEVDFYIEADDKLHTALRLAAKAYQTGRHLTVYCPDAALAERLDRSLWTTPATGFIPHCSAEDRLAGRTPVIIDRGVAEPLADDVLLNLGDERPPHFSRYRRLIEIVARDENDKQHARGRFKFYRDRGYDIRTHNLGKTAPSS
jgi:DNA polymerase-3 subunit chi